MEVDAFLILLDAPEVQKKIKAILVDQPTVENEPSNDEAASELEQASETLKDENEELINKNKALNDLISSKDEAISVLEQINETLKGESEEMNNVIKKLKEFICGKEAVISDNSSEISQLKAQLSALTQKMEAKDEEFDRLATQEKATSVQLNKSDKKLNWYREQFSEDLEIQEIYDNLSETTKGSLAGIFKSTTASGLIACGVQEKNIGNLWEYAKNEVVNDENIDIKNIIHLFDILFSRFTLAFPMYKTQMVTVGEDFDNQLYIKHNSSKNVSGVVESVLLRGYVNTKTDKIIKQSIVRI